MWRWIRKAYNSSKSISKEQNLEEALPVLEQIILSYDECVKTQFLLVIRYDDKTMIRSF